MALVTHDCELKIAMLEDDIEALKAELLKAYKEIEDYENPLNYVLKKLVGSDQFEFKYSPGELTGTKFTEKSSTLD